MRRHIERIDNAWATVEQAVLVGLVLAMIGLAFTQVILRNAFDTGLEWADVTVRHMVLWVGLLGASIAAKEKRHLSIDIASRLIPAKWFHIVEALLSLVTAAVCGLLLWASVLFVKFLQEWGTGSLEGTPAVIAGLALPVGFAGVAVRFFLRALYELSDFWTALHKNGKNGGHGAPAANNN